MKAKVYTPNDLHKRLRKGGWISNAIPDQLKSSAGRTGTDGGGGYSIKGIPEMYIYCPQIGPLYLLLFVRNFPGSQPSLVLVHSSSTFSYLVCIKLISQSHSIRTFRKCDVALIASPTRGHSLLWHWLLQPTGRSRPVAASRTCLLVMHWVSRRMQFITIIIICLRGHSFMSKQRRMLRRKKKKKRSICPVRRISRFDCSTESRWTIKGSLRPIDRLHPPSYETL